MARQGDTGGGAREAAEVEVWSVADRGPNADDDLTCVLDIRRAPLSLDGGLAPAFGRSFQHDELRLT